MRHVSHIPHRPPSSWTRASSAAVSPAGCRHESLASFNDENVARPEVGWQPALTPGRPPRPRRAHFAVVTSRTPNVDTSTGGRSCGDPEPAAAPADGVDLGDTPSVAVGVMSPARCAMTSAARVITGDVTSALGDTPLCRVTSVGGRTEVCVMTRKRRWARPNGRAQRCVVAAVSSSGVCHRLAAIAGA